MKGEVMIVREDNTTMVFINRLLLYTNQQQSVFDTRDWSDGRSPAGPTTASVGKGSKKVKALLPAKSTIDCTNSVRAKHSLKAHQERRLTDPTPTH
jgi:hypothetical protein